MELYRKILLENTISDFACTKNAIVAGVVLSIVGLFMCHYIDKKVLQSVSLSVMKRKILVELENVSLRCRLHKKTTSGQNVMFMGIKGGRYESI